MGEVASPHYLDFSFTQEYLQSFLQKEVPHLPALVSFEVLPLGWNNKTIKIIVSDHSPILLKASRSTWAYDKTINEVAGLKFIQSKTSISVPAVLAFGQATPETPFHWILMDFIEGDCLELVWRQLPLAEKQQYLETMKLYIKQLRNIQFNTIGGWKLDENSQPTHGIYFDGSYQYKSEQEFLSNFFQTLLKDLADGPLFASLQPQIEQLQQISPKLCSSISNMSSAPIVFFHGDFAFRNMMLKKDQNGKAQIVVIDWEWAATLPYYLERFDWLEENSDEDKKENIWIREMLKEFVDMKEFQLRSEIFELTYALRGYSFDDDLEKGRTGLQERIDAVLKLLPE